MGAAQAGAETKAVSGGGDSFLSASNLDTTELPDGSIEVTLANGETITVPVGYFGYDSGQLFISEKYLPFELAHAPSSAPVLLAAPVVAPAVIAAAAAAGAAVRPTPAPPPP